MKKIETLILLKLYQKTLVLLPLWGITLFFVLYITAALMYSGGSQVDKTAKGFSLMHNYWCDLLADKAQNDEPNTAQPIAISAMILLCASLLVFWYYLPKLFEPNGQYTKIIQRTGMASMVIPPFLFTNYHDTVINVGGGLGIIALLLTFINLYKSRFYKLFGVGVLCLTLCILNYFIYETKIFLSLLAVTQKASFVLFLGWLGVIDYCIYKKMQKQASILRG